MKGLDKTCSIVIANACDCQCFDQDSDAGLDWLPDLVLYREYLILNEFWKEVEQRPWFRFVDSEIRKVCLERPN